MTIRDDIRRDGYVVARNLLSAAEIAELRSQLLNHFQHSWEPEGAGKHQPNAAVEVGSISWIYTHPRILQTFRELSGHDALVFTANSDAHMNMLSWWHKDTDEGRGGCFSGDYFARQDCNVYRAGIYLQDHTAEHGLTVRKGSQHTRSLATGEVETLATRAGDVVFFDIRLTHAGQFADPIEAMLLRAGRKLGCMPLATAMKDRYQRLVGKSDKLSIFFTYGAPATDTREYCEFELAAKRTRSHGRAAHLPLGLIAALRAANISFDPALAGEASCTARTAMTVEC